MLDVHVVETEDKSKVVGYCSLNERPEEKGAGYIDLLNVQPEATLTRTAFLVLCQDLAEAKRYVALEHYHV